MKRAASSRARRVVALVGTAALALTLVGCGSKSSNSSTSGSSNGGSDSTPSGGSLTMALQGPINTFDPWSTPSGYNGSLWALGAVYDSLTHLDSSGKVQPWLATSWKVTDATHLTLELKTGVKFSDGTDFNADAVVANIKYAQTAAQPGECNSYLTGITPTATSASEVQLVLATPNPDLLTDFGTCAGLMVSPTALKNPASLKNTPVGSGAYTLATTGNVQGQTWAFQKNPNYWSTASFDKITLKFFTDATAAANAAKSGQVQVIQSVDPTKDTSGQTLLLSSPQEFRGLYITDVDGAIAPQLKDVRVRQAMNYAVDRNTIEKQIYGDAAAVSGSIPFTTNTPGYSDALANAYPYDPAKAKQLLAEAGYPNGFTVKVMNFPALLGTMTQAIAGYEKAVGITLDISDHPSDFLTELKTGNWPIVSGNYTLSTATYHNMVGILGKDGFFNPRHQTNSTFDSLLTQIANTTDDTQKTALYGQLAKAVSDQAWFIVPIFAKSASAYNKSKVSITVTPGSGVPFIYNITPA